MWGSIHRLSEGKGLAMARAEVVEKKIEDIPLHIDEFLRMLAQWTIEDLYIKPRLKGEDSPSPQPSPTRGEGEGARGSG